MTRADMAFESGGERERLTPPGPAIRAAEGAANAELVRYPAGHFDMYVGDWFERAVAEETRFLQRHLLGAGATASAAAGVKSGT